MSGTVRVPGDKSISHRALMFAAFAEGSSRLRGLQAGADVAATADVLRALGADLAPDGDALVVTGRAFGAPARDLDCRNSGTTARLMAGALAAQSFPARLVGDASLSRRPMARVARPLRAMGAELAFEDGGEHLPMTVTGGALSPVEWTSEFASAQVKSAILIAGVLGGVEAIVREPQQSRDHTERMLAARGVTVYVNPGAIWIPEGQRVEPLDAAVPGDPSSAAFFAALAALADAGSLALPDVCLNPTRTGFFAALARMGAALDYEDRRSEGGEPLGTVVARAGAPLRGAAVDAAEVPSMIDELPLLACVAARADGETAVRGAGELRVKESDRITAVVENLRAIGVEADELPDGFIVHGRGPGSLSGRVRTHGDHRIAMAFGVLGALAGNRIEVDDPACVEVSYPAFWRDLAAATGGPR